MMKMKRILVLALILALLTVAVIPAAMAESGFTLRNGIRFGQTQEQVDAQETWENITGFHLFDYTGQLIGYDSLVRYDYGAYFGKESEGLCSVIYAIGTVYEEDGGTLYSQKDTYANTLNGLIIKYYNAAMQYYKEKGEDYYNTVPGNPILSNYIVFLQSVAGSENADFEAIEVSADGSGDNSTKLIIPDGDLEVVIELNRYEIIQDGETRYLVLLSYCRLSQDTINMIQSYINDL